MTLKKKTVTCSGVALTCSRAAATTGTSMLTRSTGCGQSSKRIGSTYATFSSSEDSAVGGWNSAFSSGDVSGCDSDIVNHLQSEQAHCLGAVFA